MVQILDSSPPSHFGVLSDRFEYTYLAGRPEVTPYFWDLRTEVSASSLERYLPAVSLLVETTGHGPGFPDGFIEYLRRHHYRAVHTTFADVWVCQAPGRVM